MFGLNAGLKAYDGAELAQNKWAQPAQKTLITTFCLTIMMDLNLNFGLGRCLPNR